MINLRMTITALIVTSTIIFLGIYDLVVVVIGMVTGKSTSYSVSHFLVNIGFTSPMVVFTIGYICGHLTGYMKPVKSEDLEK